ncbi:MAG: single-stranded DNA-binding protein [Gammaproteobacteria bacterium]|jgi:single-strand DNA-binding protein|nr:single-stranded DNA-binding protein [Gammaproteobacteria bacterium]
MNTFFLSGRLGADPEVKFTKGGLAITTISIANNRRVKKDDAWEDKTDWFRIKFFGKKGEVVGEHFSKGKYINTWGRIEPFSYEKDDGQKVYGHDFCANDFDFVDKKGEGGGEAAPKARSTSSADADELPF